MELNWSTFVLEIINFLVLVWILKHFLYQPVMDLLARRRAAIETQLAEAKQQQDEADTLKQQYENRLSDWQLERQKAMEELNHELQQQRLKQHEALATELAQEQEKMRVAASRQQQQLMREMEQRALQQGAQFASRLLAEAAGPELQQRLFQLLLEGLRQLSAEQLETLVSEWGEAPQTLRVTSAYPLDEQQRQQLQQQLASVTGLSTPPDYVEDAALLAGLSITIGAWALQLNLRDELQGFVEFAHVEQ